MKSKNISKFNDFEILELQNKGCEFLTPYQGSKGNKSFRIDKKIGIILDTYFYNKNILHKIETEENLTFEQLIEKL